MTTQSLPRQYALLLIDLQQDFLSAPGLEPGRDRLVERSSVLLQYFRMSGMPVCHVWTTVSRADDERMAHWKAADRWICEAGTWGHATPEVLAPTPTEAVYHKTNFSAFSNVDLATDLRQAGVTTLVLAGLHLHACVRQTALDAMQLGWEVLIAGDAVASDDPVHGSITRRYLGARGVRLADVAGITLSEEGVTLPTASALASNVAVTCSRAQLALSSWTLIPRQEREAMVERLAKSLERDAADLATQLAQEIGKPVRYARTEILRTAIMLRAILRRIPEFPEESPRPGPSVRRRPHGVVAIITPWNNPVYISLGKILPALLCGNSVVWKPSPSAGGISCAVMALFSEAGFPVDVVCLLEGGRAIAEALMADPLVQAVAITGSSQAGSSAQDICGKRRVPLQAELGGNNAAIIWHDADLPRAAAQVTDGAFGMAGQRCTANRRAIVHEQVYDHFLELLRAATAALPSGDPLVESTCIGPLVNDRESARIAGLLGLCPQDKVRIEMIDGGAHTALEDAWTSAWHPPTIVLCEDPKLDIVQEESFGPVLVVQKASSWTECISLCNGVRQGLAAALFSRDPDLQAQFLHEARAGILKINQSTSDAEVDVPFGGWKASGIGPPEHGDFDLEFYSRPQTVYRAAEMAPGAL